MPTLKHNGHFSNTRSYWLAFAWLAILTVIEIGAVSIGFERRALVILIVGTALSKALLIALFFMHLKSENKIVWLLPGIPTLFAVIFVWALFPDMVYHLTHLL